jgi:thiol-disulfide isomerase/thioredoxin
MRRINIIMMLICICIFQCIHTPASGIIPDEGICLPDAEHSSDCENGVEPRDEQLPAKHAEKASSAVDIQKNEKPFEIIVHFFWGDGCPHCEDEKDFLNEMKKKYPGLKIIDYEAWYDKENALILSRMAKAYNVKASGVPVTFIGENVFIGFSRHTMREIEAAVRACLFSQCIDPAIVLQGKMSADDTQEVPLIGIAEEKPDELECTEKSKTVFIPWIGSLDALETSLPLMTLIIAGMDSFNPCAFFILLSLMGLLIHAQSRRKMLLIGSVFVFFSGLIYYIFMAAWLNLFLIMGQVDAITKTAATIAIIIALINIKDFFVFKKGVSLTIPDSAKPKLFDRMRKLLKSTSIVSILIGTAVLAVAANAYELLCTAGFPMVYTRILTLNNLSSFSYYMYLVFYNFIYIIPLSVIVIIFTITLGKRSLSEWHGRILKLVSGNMMLGLGGILMFNPAILSNVFVSLLLITGAVLLSALIAFLMRKTG